MSADFYHRADDQFPDNPDLMPGGGDMAASFDETPQPLHLDAIQARADAATPGPWCIYQNDLWRGTADALAAYDADPENAPWPYGDDAPYPESTGHVFHGEPIRVEDAEFIAHAREDVPALVAVIAQIRAQVEKANADPRRDGWRHIARIADILDGGVAP